jgi:glyoxylase-like metal-dependent hydrolase (beta-lactamase superfamily II)
MWLSSVDSDLGIESPGRLTMDTEIFPIALGFDTCYVLQGRGAVVLDAGQPKKRRAFLKGLRRASIQPRDIGLILLTHAHWDHMGSAKDLKEITGAPIAVHAREAAWVEGGNPPLPPGVTSWGKLFMAVHRLFMPFISVPAAGVDRRLDDDEASLEEFGVPGLVMHTPGHSPGSVSVILESGEAFVGDLAMNRLPLRLTPGLPIFADDLEEVVRSWRRIFEHEVTTIFPAHGEPFSADVMRAALQ